MTRMKGYDQTHDDHPIPTCTASPPYSMVGDDRVTGDSYHTNHNADLWSALFVFGRVSLDANPT
jgi:hypothetical protein